MAKKNDTNPLAKLLAAKMASEGDQLPNIISDLPEELIKDLAAALLRPKDLINALTNGKSSEAPKKVKKKAEKTENGESTKEDADSAKIEAALIGAAKDKENISFPDLVELAKVGKGPGKKALEALVERGVFTRSGKARGMKYALAQA
jgi:hypothetical protein